ncbi:DNA 3'-5' helicase OS=Streptomyces alboniger OX=132473 GN=CP975_23565 PE=3 SV=1 [Streptomyces alboniger]
MAPEQVLGLTFTNKAAGELAERVRKALVRAGVTDPTIHPDNPPGEPVISTYHAFAGRLLTDHGLRIGLEPTSRLLADATRYQLAARVLREAPGPYPALTRSFADLVSDLLALDAELAQDPPVRPEDLRAYDANLLRTLEGVKLTNAELRKVPETAAARRELADLVVRYRAAKRERDLLDFGDQIALSAGSRIPEVDASCATSSGWCSSTSTRTPPWPSASCSQACSAAAPATPSPRSATPARPSTAGAGPPSPTSTTFPSTSPTPTAARQPGRRSARTACSGGRLLDLANGLAGTPAGHARGRGGTPTGPRRRTRRHRPAAPCCPPTPRRSAGSPTRSRTW